MTASLLQTIVASTQRAVVAREALTPLASLRAETTASRARQSFRAALEAPSAAPRIIAECKRRSPSKGILRDAYDPASIARGYQSAGAAAISVLTEPAFFDGALDHLAAVRAEVTIPILRKDFIVSRYQIAEARAAGADAVLLIVAALGQTELVELLTAADEYGLDTLVEVHGLEELDRAVAAGGRIIGVNSRNLHTLQVDPNVFTNLAARLPSGVLAVAESGIHDAAAIVALRASGYRAFLVGERFMSASDPGAALRSVLAAAEGVPR